MLRGQWSIGSGASRKVDWRDCGRVNAPGGPVAWMRRKWGERMVLVARRPAIWDWAGLYGTARPWRLGLRKSMGLTWECVSASVCSGSWAFGYANRAPALPKPILNGRRRIKKTPDADARRDRGSLGYGRSAFPAAWFPLPDVDSAGDKRSDFAPRSHAAQSGILRRSPVPTRQIPVLPGS